MLLSVLAIHRLICVRATSVVRSYALCTGNLHFIGFQNLCACTEDRVHMFHVRKHLFMLFFFPFSIHRVIFVHETSVVGIYAQESPFYLVSELVQKIG